MAPTSSATSSQAMLGSQPFITAHRSPFATPKHSDSDNDDGNSSTSSDEGGHRNIRNLKSPTGTAALRPSASFQKSPSTSKDRTAAVFYTNAGQSQQSIPLSPSGTSTHLGVQNQQSDSHNINNLTSQKRPSFIIGFKDHDFKETTSRNRSNLGTPDPNKGGVSSTVITPRELQEQLAKKMGVLDLDSLGQQQPKKSPRTGGDQSSKKDKKDKGNSEKKSGKQKKNKDSNQKSRDKNKYNTLGQLSGLLNSGQLSPFGPQKPASSDATCRIVFEILPEPEDQLKLKQEKMKKLRISQELQEQIERFNNSGANNNNGYSLSGSDGNRNGGEKGQSQLPYEGAEFLAPDTCVGEYNQKYPPPKASEFSCNGMRLYKSLYDGNTKFNKQLQDGGGGGGKGTDNKNKIKKDLYNQEKEQQMQLGTRTTGEVYKELQKKAAKSKLNLYDLSAAHPANFDLLSTDTLDKLRQNAKGQLQDLNYKYYSIFEELEEEDEFTLYLNNKQSKKNIRKEYTDSDEPLWSKDIKKRSKVETCYNSNANDKLKEFSSNINPMFKKYETMSLYGSTKVKEYQNALRIRPSTVPSSSLLCQHHERLGTPCLYQLNDSMGTHVIVKDGLKKIGENEKRMDQQLGRQWRKNRMEEFKRYQNNNQHSSVPGIGGKRLLMGVSQEFNTDVSVDPIITQSQQQLQQQYDCQLYQQENQIEIESNLDQIQDQETERKSTVNFKIYEDQPDGDGEPQPLDKQEDLDHQKQQRFLKIRPHSQYAVQIFGGPIPDGQYHNPRKMKESDPNILAQAQQQAQANKQRRLSAIRPSTVNNIISSNDDNTLTAEPGYFDHFPKDENGCLMLHQKLPLDRPKVNDIDFNNNNDNINNNSSESQSTHPNRTFRLARVNFSNTNESLRDRAYWHLSGNLPCALRLHKYKEELEEYRKNKFSKMHQNPGVNSISGVKAGPKSKAKGKAKTKSSPKKSGVVNGKK